MAGERAKEDNFGLVVGFEFEVIVPISLNGNWLFRSHGEPYDEAPNFVLYEVARQLSACTGKKFTSPKPRSIPLKGWHVVSEYDIDPMTFDNGNFIAAVEIIMPPLPVAEALKEFYVINNFLLENEFGVTDNCGFHIGFSYTNPLYFAKDREVAFNFYINEAELLKEFGRLGNEMLTPQISYWMPPLIGQTIVDPSLRVHNFSIDSHLCMNKRTSLGFGKLQFGYIEMRHLSTTAAGEDNLLEYYISRMNDILTSVETRNNASEKMILIQKHVDAAIVWLQRGELELKREPDDSSKPFLMGIRYEVLRQGRQIAQANVYSHGVTIERPEVEGMMRSTKDYNLAFVAYHMVGPLQTYKERVAFMILMEAVLWGACTDEGREMQAIIERI